LWRSDSLKKDIDSPKVHEYAISGNRDKVIGDSPENRDNFPESNKQDA
jgi:hypothetical protein